MIIITALSSAEKTLKEKVLDIIQRDDKDAVSLTEG
jgi:hypothetical protein